MIVVNIDNIVVASAPLITIVNEQGEAELMKVHTSDGGFYYVGTQDRSTYRIIDGLDGVVGQTYNTITGELNPVIISNGVTQSYGATAS